MARKPPTLARELARNFPKRRGRGKRRRRRGGGGNPNGENHSEVVVARSLNGSGTPSSVAASPLAQGGSGPASAQAGDGRTALRNGEAASRD
jgi:hypothetical protein